MQTALIDAGNFGIKASLALDPQSRKYRPFSERSLLAKFDNERFKRDLKLNDNPQRGVYMVNGQAYAIGQVATRQTVVERPQGAARYTPQHYGVLVAITMYELMLGESGQMAVGFMYPPGDGKYIDGVRDMLKGRWDVHGHMGKATYRIMKTNAYSEPYCGLMPLMLTQDGTPRATDARNHPLYGVREVLVVDMGGFSVDIVAMSFERGVPFVDESASRTYRGNAGNYYIREFEETVRNSNLELFRDIPKLSDRVLATAFRTGNMPIGQMNINVADERGMIANQYATDIESIIYENGGLGSYDTIMLTGGGAGLLFDVLRERNPKFKFILPIPVSDIENIDRANIEGRQRIATAKAREASGLPTSPFR